MLKYKRILLKLSGEALTGNQHSGIDARRLMKYAEAIKEAAEAGVHTGIVFGGGNIFRGLKGVDKGFDRVKGDYMGMLATVINGLAIQSALEQLGMKVRLFTAIRMEPIGEGYSKSKMMEALDRGETVIFSAGTGNPYFTTDTAAALRAVEMEADALLKGTRVDGVYTADPEKDASAVKFETMSFDKAYRLKLQVMDLTSFTMCRENNMPVVVFNMNKEGELMRVLKGENVGTLIRPNTL
ncbi:MAG: UMP kinase [Bacteroidales bacterium]|jgi:uridylate kinase|nr:UMP kinase [Bacteroidales bacterium]